MENLRERAISAVSNRPISPNEPIRPVSDILDTYGSDVFSVQTMQKHLSAKTFNRLMKTIRNGARLDPAIADEVAKAMKDWAVERGATHYTHWFQPLTGATAEKHESFLEPSSNGESILKFSGKNLIVGESDASSFPSGGLRSTFEARGYTAWDPSSSAFLRRGINTVTLCIPTAFCSYTGEALDRKTPLLRSIQALTAAVKHLMKAFHAEDKNAEVSVSLGAEQEYFLIDRHFYYARPDLVQCGRTLFGATPPKHQQLEDHYYGAIHPRILAFMADVDHQLWCLGIPAKTRHNEVAPAQFEIAPIFEEVNLAVDHNMVLMEVLRLTAEKHGFVCLLHEKPFAGVNGSGKHNNWSICYGKLNMLDPGTDPHQNALFLTTLCAMIHAVDKHADLLRASTATFGNEQRLGACEAPPTVISMFLGEQLTDILDQIIKGGKKTAKGKQSKLSIGVDRLPPLPKDATDRNRTSPFAFTGNKFEFRTPGSSQSCAGVNVIINTIAADSIEKMANEIENFDAKKDFNTQLQSLLRRILIAHKRIIFNGNGYDDAWRIESKKRGLPNFPHTSEALAQFKTPENIELFQKAGVFSKAELLSRYEIFMEEFESKARIENELSILLARTVVTPAAVKALDGVCTAINSAKKSGMDVDYLRNTANHISTLVKNILDFCCVMEKLTDPAEMVGKQQKLREMVDELERNISDSIWPLPKYREMMFIY